MFILLILLVRSGLAAASIESTRLGRRAAGNVCTWFLWKVKREIKPVSIRSDSKCAVRIALQCVTSACDKLNKLCNRWLLLFFSRSSSSVCFTHVYHHHEVNARRRKSADEIKTTNEMQYMYWVKMKSIGVDCVRGFGRKGEPEWTNRAKNTGVKNGSEKRCETRDEKKNSRWLNGMCV